MHHQKSNTLDTLEKYTDQQYRFVKKYEIGQSGHRKVPPDSVNVVFKNPQAIIKMVLLLSKRATLSIHQFSVPQGPILTRVSGELEPIAVYRHVDKQTFTPR